MIWEIDDRAPTVEGLDANGRAIPAYAASLGLVPAPFGRRAAATTIEVLIVLVLLLPLYVGALPITLSSIDPVSGAVDLSGSDLVWVLVLGGASWLLVTVFIIVQMALHGRKGVTAGKAMFGIRSVNVRTLERPGFWRGAVVRYLVMSVSFWIPLFGPLLVIALSPFFDTERRGRSWVDHAGATWLVDVRDGLNPYDAKRMRIARKTAATDLRDERPSLPSLATPGVAGMPAGYVPSARNSGGVIGATVAVPQIPDAAPAPAREVSVPLHGGAAVHGGAATPPPAAPTAGPTSAAAPSAPTRPAFSAPEGAAVASGLISSVPGAQRREIEMWIQLDSGEVVTVEGSGLLIGRAPAAAAGETGMGLLPVQDDAKSVSKTHLALVRTGSALAAVDRGSTNGSAIVRAGDERVLLPGESVELVDRDTVRFGDRTATVRIG
ncbi:RDD family protein [Microbacterium sp. C7(2022)]|uniref:RDD family protein n=1 Tax=Microbacterium sp. C7(2022) TaxID=2992759 RepID=UPI00237C3098|nr:RDD family protein [Microbacterium sp. C7(2022)]MDE0547475.1 RDD family protein [Microbacterium sp. C7(2022)]